MFSPVSAADCEAPHRGELAGTFRLSNIDWTDESAVSTEFDLGCTPVARRFLGQYTAMPEELLLWYYYDGARDYLDQTVLCVVGTDSSARKIVGSLKNIGDGEVTIV